MLAWSSWSESDEDSEEEAEDDDDEDEEDACCGFLVGKIFGGACDADATSKDGRWGAAVDLRAVCLVRAMGGEHRVWGKCEAYLVSLTLF